jgi:hypothetical protein
MPKPVDLTPGLVGGQQITPQAATNARTLVQTKVVEAPKPTPVPLQLRLPREEVRAIKIAAAQRDQTLSEFMLACFHAFMKR